MDHGEAVLADSRRLKAFFAGLAKDEPKPLRVAFGRCMEAGAYNALKTAQDAAERADHKAAVAQRVRDEQGLDVALCGEAMDILEAALFGGAAVGVKQPEAPSAPQKQSGGGKGAAVYVAGKEGDKAVYWKNGQKVVLSREKSFAPSIFVSGSDVYAAGSEDCEAVYWKNGKKTVLSNDSYSAAAYSIFVIDAEATQGGFYASCCTALAPGDAFCSDCGAKTTGN